MSKLDVEQQLRLLQERQKAAGVATPTHPKHTAFLSKENFDDVFQLSVVIAGGVVVALCALLCLTLAVNKLRVRLLEGLRNAHAVVFSTSCNVLAYCCFMATWILTIVVNGVFRLMERAALDAAKNGRRGSPAALSDLRPFAVPLCLFLLEYVGVVVLWLYPLSRTSFTMEIGVIGALMVFFPGLYQSLALDSGAPERLPVWTSHAVFLVSLFVLYAVGYPWLRREYRAALRELHAHANSALYRQRPESRDLRARHAAKNKRR